MTRFQALYVAYLRCRCEGTWRWVSVRYHQRYDEKIPFQGDGFACTYGNQIIGADLCSQASAILGFNVD